MNQIRLKIYFTLSFFTAILTAVELHFVEPLFNSRWLRPAIFDSVSEKFLFVIMILALSFAAVGIWLTIWFKLFDKITGKSKKIDFLATLMWNIFLWFDFYIRYKIFLVWGGNFRLDTTKASTEQTGQIITNLWRWYSTDIMIIFAGIPLAVLFTWLMVKALTSEMLTFKVRRQSVIRLFRYTVLSAVVIVILFLTAFVSIWPEGRSAIAVRSSVGYPFAQSISIASDFDNDGWGYFDVPRDLKPFDSRCRPYAIDIPNDGLDQDLIAGDLKSKELDRWQKKYGESITSPLIAHENNRQNVMVVFVESLRFDALKKMIGNRKVMPNMQKMIKNGALSPNHAYASQGYTYSSVKQFLFGGFDDNGSTVMDDFKLSGYETTVFTGYNLKEEPFGKYLTADYIFDTRKDMERKSYQHSTPARRVVKSFNNFLNNRDNTKPFFSFFFFTDPHFPYKQVNTPVLCKKHISTSDIKPQNRELVQQSYYDQVWHVDKAAGGILDSLDAHNIKNNTTIIFIGDHGESLYDDGETIGHGLEINDVMTHTAMVVVNPVVDFPDVLSHMHLRKMIHNVISADKTIEHVAKLLPLKDRKLFQYTGSLRYPKEIGLFSVEDGRIVYKIQEDELTASKIDDGETEDITSLRNNKFEKQIINKWEYTLFKDSRYEPMLPAKNL